MTFVCLWSSILVMSSNTSNTSCIYGDQYLQQTLPNNSNVFAFVDDDGYQAAKYAYELMWLTQSGTNFGNYLSTFHSPTNTTAPYGLISQQSLHRICGPYPDADNFSGDLFKQIVNFYLLPLLTILVLITNFFTCLVLIKPHMCRNPVFLILLVIALIELTNSLLPLPMYLGQSFHRQSVWWSRPDFENFTIYESYLINTNWRLPAPNNYRTSSNVIISKLSAWTTVFLPTIAHTISVWLTVALAFQRLIFLGNSGNSCTNRTVYISKSVCVIICLMAFMIHLPLLRARFVLFKPIIIKTSSEQFTHHLNDEKCLLNLITHLPGIVLKCHLLEPVYMFIYYCARLVLIHLLPCAVLLILTTLLVIKMKQVVKLRKRLGLNVRAQSNTTRLIDASQNCDLHKLHRKLQSLLTQFKQTKCQCTHKSINQNAHTRCRDKSSRCKMHSTNNPQDVSKMLIVVLVKFIAMHLPNAVVLLIYLVKSIWKQTKLISSSSPSLLSSSSPPPSSVIITQTRKLATTTVQYDMTKVNRTLTYQSLLDINESNDNHDYLDYYLSRIGLLCNLIILLSYQLNFFIYYTMSSNFRDTFHNLCKFTNKLDKKLHPSADQSHLSAPHRTRAMKQLTTTNQVGHNDSDKNIVNENTDFNNTSSITCLPPRNAMVPVTATAQIISPDHKVVSYLTDITKLDNQ